MLFALSSFIGSLATKCVSISNASCMTIPTLLNLNLIELNHYPFVISFHKSKGI